MLVPLVGGALHPELVLAPDLEFLGAVLYLREGPPVAPENLPPNLLQAYTPDALGRAGEVFLDHLSLRPTASKIWAPQYENKVEMPILEIIFKSAFSLALTKFLDASSGVTSPTSPVSTMSSMVSKAR